MSWSILHRGSTTYKNHLSLQYQYELAAESARGPIKQVLSNHAAKICGTIEKSVGELNFSLNEVRDAVQHGNELLDWGFSNMLSELGGMAQTLDEIREIGKNQGKTKAYEHYADAQYAFDRKLYAESLRAVTKAIEGIDGAEGGYELEWRFHYLRGLIFLGSANEEHIEIMDLEEAESNFLMAFRYARSDSNADAAMALINAGWAAYCLAAEEQGTNATTLQRAESYLADACRIKPESATALYNRARTLLAMGREQEAIESLRGALQISDKFLRVLATDAAFSDHRDAVDEMLRTVHVQTGQRVFETIERQLKGISALIEHVGFTTTFHHSGQILGVTKSDPDLAWLQAVYREPTSLSLPQMHEFLSEKVGRKDKICAQIRSQAGVRANVLDALRSDDRQRASNRSMYFHPVVLTVGIVVLGPSTLFLMMLWGVAVPPLSELSTAIRESAYLWPTTGALGVLMSWALVWYRNFHNSPRCLSSVDRKALEQQTKTTGQDLVAADILPSTTTKLQ